MQTVVTTAGTGVSAVANSPDNTSGNIETEPRPESPVVPMPSADPRSERPAWTGPVAESPGAHGGASEPDVALPLDGWLQRSPPFTLSLALHVVVLLLLALLVVRQPRSERLRLELVFGSEPGSGANVEGVTIQSQDDGAEDSQPPQEPKPAEEMATAPPPVEARDRSAETRSTAMPFEPISAAAVAEAASARTAPSVRLALSGRSAGRRDELLAAGGGGGETETAVEMALEWLVRNQEKGGLWSLRGPYLDGVGQRPENRLAATAMALLALQGAGNTTADGPYQAAVQRAWKAILARQQADGTFDLGQIPEQHAMYAHAQVTIALCELYGMTHDATVQAAAQRAVDYAVAGQMPDGGWKYQPPRPNHPNRGDMSVSGWYMMALKSGEMAGLDVPDETYGRLAAFLDAVFISDEIGYGYEIKTQAPPAPAEGDDEGGERKRFFQIRPAVRTALTAEALLCRQFLGWRRDDPRLRAGVALLFREVPRDFEYPDVYAWYYVTQVCHHFGGDPWREWNAWMRATLPSAQVSRGKEKGSWNPAHDKWGYNGGRLFMTCMCACMLEVYYRHLPLFSAVE